MRAGPGEPGGCCTQSSKLSVFTILKLGFRETGRGRETPAHAWLQLTSPRLQTWRGSAMNVPWIKTGPSVVKRSSWLDSARGTFPGGVKEAVEAQTAQQTGELLRAEQWSLGLSQPPDQHMAHLSSVRTSEAGGRETAPVPWLAQLWRQQTLWDAEILASLKCVGRSFFPFES